MDYIEKLDLQTDEVKEVENLEKHTITNNKPFSVDDYEGHDRDFLALDGEFNDGFKQLKETTGIGINCIVSRRVNELRTSLDKAINILNNAYNSKYKYSINELMGGADIEVYGLDSYYVTKLQCTLDNSLLTLNMQQGLKPNYNIGVDGKSLKDPFVYKENGVYYMYVTYFSNPTADDSDIALFKSSNGIDFEFTKIVVDRNNCWGDSGGTIWAPTVVKVIDIYYMFVSSGLNGYISGYLISDNLETGWSWVDVCKDSNGNTLDIIDINFNYINNEFYMLGAKPAPSSIVLYKGDLINNSWHEVKTLITHEEKWEGSITEAPQIIEYENKFILLYGGNNSATKQRIGIAVSDKIDGDYKKEGLLGQLLLDFPLSSRGTIAHPHILYENGEFTLYTCVGLTSDNNTNMKIMIYKGKEILKLNPTKVEKTLIQGKNYVYINNSGLIINSGDMPYYMTDLSINIDMCNRIGFIYLGIINWENDGFVVNPYREYETVAIFNAKKEWTTTISDTKINSDIWSYIGGCYPGYQRKKGKLVGKINVGCHAKDNENIYVRLLINGEALDETILTFNKNIFEDKESKWVELYDNQWDMLNITLQITGATSEYVMGGNATIVLAIEK